MSHVVKQKTKITDPGAMAAAAAQLGLKFEEAKQFRYFAGRQHNCSYKISHPEAKNEWEVGLVQEKDGTYSLAYDSMMHTGYKIGAAIGGNDAHLLKQAYATQLALASMPGSYIEHQEVLQDGSLYVQLGING